MSDATAFWEVTMFKDRMIVWFLEYLFGGMFGGMLVIVPLASQSLRRFAWTNTYLWTAKLFVACLGVILISCASSMRQRLLLARRIDELAEQISAAARVQPGLLSTRWHSRLCGDRTLRSISGDWIFSIYPGSRRTRLLRI